MDDPAEGLAPAELADCVVRALSLPEIASLKPGLVPEFAVYAAADMGAHEEAAAGIVDRRRGTSGMALNAVDNATKAKPYLPDTAAQLI